MVTTHDGGGRYFIGTGVGFFPVALRTCPDLTISFGKDHVLIPERLAGLLRQLPWRRQIGPSGTVTAAGQWLFPGRQAGQPIHPDHLRVRLKALGIATRPARQAALLQLAREVPAAVLADMLNIDEGTATAWAARAGATWNVYAARRLQNPTATNSGVRASD